MKSYLNKQDREIIRNVLKDQKRELTEIQWPSTDDEISEYAKSMIQMSDGDFNKNISSCLNFFKNGWTASQKQLMEKMPFEMYISDLAICTHFLIYELLLTYFFPNSLKKVDTKLSKTVQSRFAYFALGYTNIIFSLAESRQNYIEGKSLMGNVLFRHFSEVFESNILALVDNEYYNIIKSDVSDKEQENRRWHRIKPSKVKARLDKYFENYVDAEFQESVKSVKEFLYNINSKSVHGDFHAQFMENFKSNDSSEELLFDFFGHNDNLLRAYFTNFIVYNYNMLIVLFTAFINYHRLPMGKFGRVGKEIAYVFKVYESLMKIYLRNYNLERNY